MDKTSFLKELENALEGEVSREVINDTLNYYNQYIVSEVNAGKSEDEVIRGLGSGNVIAKTVIASQEAKAGEGPFGTTSEAYGYGAGQGSSFFGGQQRYGAPEEKGLHMSMDEQGNMKLKYGKFQFNSWYGKLLGILILALFVALVVLLIAGLFSLLWTLLPIFLVGFLIITVINYLTER